MFKRIVVFGRDGAGKSTFAGMLQRELPGSTVTGFAHELKRVASLLFDGHSLIGEGFENALNLTPEQKKQPVLLLEKKTSGAAQLKELVDFWGCRAALPLSAFDALQLLYVFRHDPHHWVGKNVYEPITPRDVWRGLGTFVKEHIHPELWARLVLYNRGTDDPQNRHVEIVEDGRFQNEFHLARKTGALTVLVMRAANNVRKPEHESDHPLPDWLVDQFDCVVRNNGELSDLAEEAECFLYRRGLL